MRGLPRRSIQSRSDEAEIQGLLHGELEALEGWGSNAHRHRGNRLAIQSREDSRNLSGGFAGPTAAFQTPAFHAWPEASSTCFQPQADAV